MVPRWCRSDQLARRAVDKLGTRQAEQSTSRAVGGPAFPQHLALVLASFGERVVVLAAVAFLGAVAAIAVVEQRGDSATPATFASAVAPSGWNHAFAGSRGAVGDAQRTSCGEILTSRSLGVTHPVLPCGAKLVLRNGDAEILTEVIDNTLVQPGRQIEVTERLAHMLHLEGTEEIEWRFAADENG